MPRRGTISACACSADSARGGSPVAGSDRMRDWRVTGSLLGLDVRLAEFSLVRVSSRPPSVRPTINDADRRVLIEAVALVEAASLNDADRDRIVASIQKGRATTRRGTNARARDCAGG